MGGNQAVTVKMPAVVKKLLGKPPLLRDESPKEYRDFLDSVVAGVKPEEIIEWIWTLRFVDCAWAALRWRHHRAVYLDSRHKSALLNVVRSATFSAMSSSGPKTGEEAAAVVEVVTAELDKWTTDPSLFEKHKIDPDLVPATALVQHVDVLDKLDRLIERAERQCDEVVQMLEVRRAVFASRARETARQAKALDAPKAIAPLAVPPDITIRGLPGQNP